MAEHTGNELRLFRKRLRMTQEELATRIGANRAQYANWEVGTAKPPYQFMVKLEELGFAPGGIGEFGTPIRVRATRRQLRLLIDMLAEESTSAALRKSAREELYAALGLAMDDDA